MSIWIVVSLLIISVGLNIYFGLKCHKHKNNHNCRETDIRTMLNSFEVEIRNMKKKYNLGK